MAHLNGCEYWIVVDGADDPLVRSISRSQLHVELLRLRHDGIEGVAAEFLSHGVANDERLGWEATVDIPSVLHGVLLGQVEKVSRGIDGSGRTTP